LYSSWRRNSNGLASKIERFSPDFCATFFVADLLMFLTCRSSITTTTWFFADVVRGFVYEILPDVGDFGVQLGDTGFRLTPPLRELLFLRQTVLQFRQFRQEILERLALVYNFTVGQGCQFDDAPIQPDG
jgi:hypothetical protein